MKISACIITNNELSVLKTIESIYDSVTEIILTHTNAKGCERLNRLVPLMCEIHDIDPKNKIKHKFYKWNDSFSDARNYCISKATQDWILIIDSDEIMRQQIHFLSDDAEGYFVKIYNGEKPYWNIRIFKNDIGVKFKYKLHESIESLALTHKVLYSDLEFTHTGCDLSESELCEKINRNERIMLTDLENPVRNYHLGLFRMYKKSWKHAIYYFCKVFEDDVNNEHKAMACNYAFRCYQELGITEKSLLSMSLKYFPYQHTARLELIGCLVGCMKQEKDVKLCEELKTLSLKELKRLSTIPTQLTNDINLNSDFISQKIEEIQKWQLQ